MFGFDDVVGQAEAKERLLAEAGSGQIPHAMLMCGPHGCGKMALALAYAHYLSCLNRTGNAPCGRCPQCQQWEKLMHPDVHFMFPIVKRKKDGLETCDDYLPLWRRMLTESTYFSYAHWMDVIEVGNSQPIIYSRESDEIAHKLSLKSVEGGYKTTIIWLPEKFQEDCANKMLKLLEEPPQKTLFFLVSEEPEKILPTIVSRTQRFEMKRIGDNDVQYALENRLGVNPEDARTIARMAGGDFVRALETIRIDNDNEYFFNSFVNLMRLAYQRKLKELKKWSEEMASLGREKQKDFLGYCQRMVRENFIFNLHRNELNYMSVRERGFAERFAPFINEKNVMGIERELSEAQEHIEKNVNAKMVFFDFAMQVIVLILRR